MDESTIETRDCASIFNLIRDVASLAENARRTEHGKGGGKRRRVLLRVARRDEGPTLPWRAKGPYRGLMTTTFNAVCM